MRSPAWTGTTELSEGTFSATSGMVTSCSRGMPLSTASKSVMIFVVLAGYMRTNEPLSKSTSPVSPSMSTAVCA